MNFPESVKLVEVGPRDGLQNEKMPLSVEDKVKLINMLSETGLNYIESGAFVSAKWVPQMASSDEVFNKINRLSHITYAGLTPNLRGLQTALESNVNEVAVFGAASEAFSQKNINCSIEESIERFIPVIEEAHRNNIKVRGYVSCVVGCPYEGEIAPKKVAMVAKKLIELGCYEVSLGDTIGVGTVSSVKKMLQAVCAEVDSNKLAAHFHDTYGQALTNIYAAMEHGINVFDTAVAGLGGCPYAKGASGNVATEDVIYMLNGLGIDHGVNLQKVAEAGWFISDVLGKVPTSKVSNALRANAESDQD